MREMLKFISAMVVVIMFMLIFLIGKLIEITPIILLLANP